MFKVGDRVVANDLHNYNVAIDNQLGKIIGFSRMNDLIVRLDNNEIINNIEENDVDYDGGIVFEAYELEHAILDNPLNRKLYPNRIVKNGYLIRKEE